MRKSLFISLCLASLTATALQAQVRLPEKGGEPYRIQQVVSPRQALPAVATRHILRSPQHDAVDASAYAGRTFYGNLVNSNDWAGASIGSVPYGVYSYTFGDNADFSAISTADTYNFMASAYGRNRLIGVFPMSIMGALNGVRYICLDSANFKQDWEEIYSGVSYGYIPTVMAYDPTSDKFYGAMYNDQLNGINWAVFNEKTRKFETLKKWSNDFQPVTLAATPDGRLFSIGLDGYFYEIDKATGDASMVGQPGPVPSNYVQAMGYDGRTGTFLWEAVTDDGTGLYSVDTETGEATLVNGLSKNEQLSSLFFKSNEAKDKAPAAINDMALSFTGTAAQQGDLTFTVPSKAYDGSALSGNVDMTVYIDGNEVKTATVAPGSKQTQAVELSNDNHYIDVVLKNDNGFAPNNYVYQYVGYDTPNPVTDVALTVDSTAQKFNITWKAPVDGVNKGYLDKANLKYNVVRMPDSVTVANGLTDTAFADPAPSTLHRYYYRVYPVNNDKTGDYAESNRVLYGDAYSVPYSDDFDSEETQPLFTIIDANNDGATWSYNTWNKDMSINTVNYSAKDTFNDWLITPGVKLKKGIAYGLVYNMRNTFRGAYEGYKILYGTDPADTTSFKLISACDSFDVSGTLTDIENDITVDADGTYYFALVCTSQKAHGSGIFVEKISVDALGSTEAPAAPADLAVKADENGAMKGTISFTAPTKTLGGTDLTGSLIANIYRDKGTEPIASLDVTAGSKASYTDDAVTGVGTHSYTVAIANDKGEGKKVSASAFIGIYTPTYTNTFDDEGSDAFFTSYLNCEPVDGYNVIGWKYNSYSHDLELGYYPSQDALPATMDLMFPAIKLDKDSVYEVSFTWDNSIWGTAEAPAEFGYSRSGQPSDLVKIGDLPKTAYGANKLMAFDIVTTDAGRYYPYVSISTEEANYLSPTIDSIVIKTIGSAFAPDSVTNLKAVNDPTGALAATVSFNAPAKDYAGNGLSGALAVDIYRGANNTIPVKTFSSVTPGETLTWTDNSALKGYDSYMVVARNDYGRGRAASDTCYVGVDQPLGVSNYTVKGNDANTGARLSWDAPTGGVHGGVIDGSLQYIVGEYFPNESDASKMLQVVGTTKQTSYNINNVETADTQAVHYYTVIPTTSAGYDLHYAYINYVVLGKPYALPFKESFANGAESTNVWLTGSSSNYATWSEPQDGQTYKSQDGDNGMALYYFGSYYEGEAKGQLVSPKFAAADEGAYAEFWVYTGIANNYTNPAYLVVSQNADDGAYTILADTIFIKDGTSGWTKFHMPLKAFGSYGTLRFDARVSGGYDYVFIDNVTISSPTADGIQTVTGRSTGIRGVKNGISFLGERGNVFHIYTLDGRNVDTFTSTGNDIRTLTPGAYIVTDGQTSRKVVVK